MKKSKKIVSVIIPAYNEEKNIERCLLSISKQTYRNTEVILVDDHSSDFTVAKALEISKKFKLNLKIKSFSVHQERGIIRNIGAEMASGDYLLFIDSDMELSQRVLNDCMSLINKSKLIKAVIIKEESKGSGFWTECRILEKKCYTGDDGIEAARFFEKKLFWKVGGWNTKMISGEDWDLTRRVREKYAVGRVSSPIYHNEGEINIFRSARKKYYYTIKAGPYLENNPLTLKKIISFGIRPAFMRNWRLLIADPIHCLGMFVLKGAEFSAGLLGFLRLKIS